jgi:hypothetical protein
MADISSLLANAAQTNADFDLGKINRSYWQGRDEAFKNEGRDLFKGGIPKNADGSIDYSAMRNALFQHGDVGQGIALDNIDIQRQQLKLGQDVSSSIGRMEGGTAPQAQTTPPGVANPPSANRTASAVVAPPLNRGGQQASAKSPQGDQPGSIMGMISALNVPDELAGPIMQQVSAATRMDPNATVPPEVAPRVQQIVAEVVRRQQQPQGPQAQPAPNPQQNQGTFGAPPATPTRGAVPTGTDPEIQKQIAAYTQIASNPALPKSVQEAALTRLRALQDQFQPTPDIKNYDLYRRQGGNLSFQDYQSDAESRKTAATEEAKLGSKKYEGLIEAGTKAQIEIPQLELMQQQMNDSNFFSGTGEKYNLAYKRLKSAVGIDPEAAVPQEMLRKVTSANILSGLGALKGLGQIRVAEINLAKDAAASPDNSIPANKFLIETSKRTHERSAEIAEMAQAYKEKNGTLDAGFDKQVTAFYKTHPLYSDAEIKDWHKIIGEARAPSSSAGPSGGAQQFASPSDVHAAIASGKLKRGDTFTDPSGKTRQVP